MTYKEFTRQLGKAGLSVTEFSELVGMNRNSISNYAQRPDVPSHLAIIATLMGEMAEKEIDFRGVIEGIDVKPKKARGSTPSGAQPCNGKDN
ncbi:XRE family transcriptional regulator [Microbulbifer sp. CAU 1566]|uniref:XRE family transcriptional regulator n=1 Tax=Microbulbifer sp. CAU 1566 TaxID=2933269 RepID=UPI002003E38A|nr:XRE family transcriptional regulator [Microbulbifer sp. CAU 1566]MCK7598214.1 XRE family transcriptional regulator [Microbulbifer sp. CAU 1566]